MTTPLSEEAARLISPGGPHHDIHELLEVEFVEVTAERVELRLPVTWKVHQPFGILHGGVSALLAESAASIGGAMACGPDHHVVGIELNASHLRGLSDGHLTAVATPARVGRSVQVWTISLTDDDGRAICEARCTLAVLADPGGRGGAAGAPKSSE